MNPGYIFGWGRTKHIDSGRRELMVSWPIGLCGATGGAWLSDDEKAARSVCKHCERIAARIEAAEGKS